MHKIESRPLRTAPILRSSDDEDSNGSGGLRYNYLFYIDFIGSTAEVPFYSRDVRYVLYILYVVRILRV
jgi:hypothetical protein